MDPKESFPAGIPHPSPSPPGNHGDGKPGVDEPLTNISTTVLSSEVGPGCDFYWLKSALCKMYNLTLTSRFMLELGNRGAKG
jgi:hypothetical protein